MNPVDTVARQAENSRVLTNFGDNQRWRARCYRPRTEREVLEILARHPSKRIRAIGSLHSWSDIAIAPDVVLDMGEFSEVQPRVADGVVRVGAGCTVQRLLDRLHSGTDQTLPALGAITKQTIAGAISTATHGSGRQTLSHFIAAVRFAAYDPSGEPKIFEYREPWFSISLFTYHGPRNRGACYGLCSWCARALHALFGARLHWGKHYPLGAAETARMYPNLDRFRSICRASDPAGVFRNDFTDRVLQLR